MPHKICVKCNKQCGVRTKICECGEPFTKKDKVPVNNIDDKTLAQKSIGTWINDIPKGMPKVSMPAGLESEPKLLDNKTIKHYVSYEGLGFAITTYIPVDRIEDEKLKEMWDEAKQKMIEIIDYLEK
jgi:hypothetical protein